MAETKGLEASTLKAFENAAAGHDGVLSDPSGELLIKPCTKHEVEFYEHTLLDHPAFAEMMPTFMGTLSLGAPAQVVDVTAAHEGLQQTQPQRDPQARGAKLNTDVAIVLGNLEHGFHHPCVLDIKLGARLYADGTNAEKAARLDKVSSETTSGSLNFRIAGMRVWNGDTYDIYDKFYGRNFNARNVKDGFATFFSRMSSGTSPDDAAQLLEIIQAEVSKIRHALERLESRMYSASLLVVYEGDNAALESLLGVSSKTPKADEEVPSLREVKESIEEEEEENVEPVAFKVKLIDFAHAAWTPGKGKDENVIKGLKKVEDQLDQLIMRFQ